MKYETLVNSFEQYKAPRITIDLDSGTPIEIIRSGEHISFDEWIGELVELKVKEIINDRTLVIKLLDWL